MPSRPTIIFVHGLGLSGDVWKPQELWCKINNFCFITLTLAGHGKRRDDQISIESMVSEIVEIACKNKKVILVGHSFGVFLCSLAIPRLKNIESALFINPLFRSQQIRPSFSLFVKIAGFLQRVFGVGAAGDYSDGGETFWRWKIYPYCLAHNPANIISNLLNQIKRQGENVFSPCHGFPTTIITSHRDELLVPVIPSEVIPVSGHMLTRLAPAIVNRFLARSASYRAACHE